LKNKVESLGNFFKNKKMLDFHCFTYCLVEVDLRIKEKKIVIGSKNLHKILKNNTSIFFNFSNKPQFLRKIQSKL